MNKINIEKATFSILTASRRPEGYLNLVRQLEEKLSNYVVEYLCFIDKAELKPEYDKIKEQYPKVKIILAQENYIWKNGWDSVYNLLIKSSKAVMCWLLFDSDEIVLDNTEQFIHDLYDGELFGINTKMQRGNVFENKFQLFYNNGNIKYFGIVHENQVFLKHSPNIVVLNSIRINHNNALDKNSKELKKTEDGIPILEMEEEGTDGYNRNVLYEGLTWKVVNQNGRQQNRDYLIRYYNVNKDIIDEYYKIASEKWK